MAETRLETSVFRFIFRYSKMQQVYVAVVTALTLPLLYGGLEIAKMIVNEAIQGEGFPKDPLGVGVVLGQFEFLFGLCVVWLLVIFMYQGLKYHVNVYRGRLGERLLRRLRFELYSNVLRFPLSHFKRIGSGEIIPMVTSEVEPLGGFMGDAFSLPILQAGTLATYMTFMFVQDFWLGLAAVAFFPVQIYVIPKLQRKVNLLAKERVRTVRKLSDRIGESVLGAEEIHASNASRLMRADIAQRLFRIYQIRYELFIRKNFIKFLNNFLHQLTPFFFYSAGGYFVITGQISWGALVVVLTAYKDVAAPWKEMLQFYQLKEDVRIKYEQVIEQFEPEGMLPPELQHEDPDQVPSFDGDLVASNLRLSDDGRVYQVDGTSFSVSMAQHVAIVGPGGSGKEELAMLLARLNAPTGGSVTMGGHKLADLPEGVVGRRIGYAGPQAFLFSSTIYENVTMGLKHRPLADVAYQGDDAKHRKTYIHESELTANIDDDLAADWIDYEAAGVDDARGLILKIQEILRLVQLDEDVYGFGLRGSIDPATHSELAEKFLEARKAAQERLADASHKGLVEAFDAASYNTNATVAENLLFGTPRSADFDIANLAANDYVLKILDDEGLTGDFLRIGYEVAQTMVELFADLPPGHEFFSQYSFIESEELPEVQATITRVAINELDQLRPDERRRLLSLPFFLNERRHRLGLIDEAMQERILKARRAFADNLPEELSGAVEFFDPERYNAAATLQDNILFGKIVHGQAQAASKIGALIRSIIDELELRDEVTFVGLRHQVGIGGGRLSAAQRQKLALARGLLKQPDLLIVNEATAALDTSGQTQVMENILAARVGKGIVWVLHRTSLARSFDHIIVMEAGRVAEQGDADSLDTEGTAFRRLVEAE